MGSSLPEDYRDRVGAVFLIELHSAQSMRVSLESIRCGKGGLDAHRQTMLNQAPRPGDWAEFPSGHLKIKDLAYLTAKTGHEFAILQGKNKEILFHGESCRCIFDEALSDMLVSGKLSICGHSHPGEDIPIPSKPDRETLKKIGQNSSILISGMSGLEVTYTADLFDDIFL